MRKWSWPGLVLLLVWVLAGCGAGEPVQVVNLTGGGTSIAPPPAAAAAPGELIVSMKAMKFEPAALEVAAGTRVTFRNDDPFPHSVWEGVPEQLNQYTPLFTSPERMAQGETWSYTFDKPGTYLYFCNTDGHWTLGMKAQIIVK